VRLLRSGANISIIAPRRIGKTSLMREVAQRSASELSAIHIDLQSATMPADVVTELTIASRGHHELHRRVRAAILDKIEAVDKLSYGELVVQVRDVAAKNWQRAADRLLDELAAQQPPTVIYIDELAILVNRLLYSEDATPTAEQIARVDELMSWLRAATIRHAGKLRFVIASSIGLSPILARARLSATLNTFTPFPLAPWDYGTATGALLALANAAHIEWADGAPQAVIARLGVCIPHHVQVFWSHLQLDARRRNVFRVTEQDVERVFRSEMLSSHGHAELSHYEERLQSMLGKRAFELAIDLLSEAAICGPLSFPAARTLAAAHGPAALREVMDVLLHDGYLQLDDETYQFPSVYLREWWKTRHRATHRPLAERLEVRHG
jgi:hypothetical protein